MRCKTCKGKGNLIKEVKLGKNQGTQEIQEICPACDGSGKTNERKRGGKDKGFDWSIAD